MVQHEQLPHTFVADAVLAGQDQRVGEELLTDGADQLPLNVLDGNLRMEPDVFSITNTSSLFMDIFLKVYFKKSITCITCEVLEKEINEQRNQEVNDFNF